MDMLLVGLVLLSLINTALIISFWIKQSARKKDAGMDLLQKELGKIGSVLDSISAQIRDDFKTNRQESREMHRENREETAANFRYFSEQTGKSFESIHKGVEKKLEEMRLTVDEKLQKTLENRLSQSFKLVQDQLEHVQKGLGEMQNLAQDVGGLKKVLGNVKMRGGLGEVQLSMLLENVLAPGQYEANVATRLDSHDRVEFALKLPGRDNPSKMVYLPIDAKFPKDIYDNLIEAYDKGEADDIKLKQDQMLKMVKKMAAEIRDKYLDPPNTTDFAIMFLPFENIYAEVVRHSSLLEQLQREYKVIVTGPTTLAAILNSLQMGFRSLAIQKRSSEVWETLAVVKTEFGKFGEMLDKVHKNLQTANGQLETVMGPRTRAIQRKLKDIEALPGSDTPDLLD
ncbi:MAG: DNA recombination protein RmuC [Cyclobacteriaceae bacterium]